MNVKIRMTLVALGAAATTVGATATASAASWSPAQKIPNDRASATNAGDPSNVVANVATNGKASIVFNAKGNRLWVSRRSSANARFAKPTRAFPKIRPSTSEFDVAMDNRTRLSLVSGIGGSKGLTGVAGGLETSKGFDSAKRLSPRNGLTYSGPTIVSRPNGEVYAGFSGESSGAAAAYVRGGKTTNGRFSGLNSLGGLTGTTQIQPPHLEMGVANNGTLYVAFSLEDGTITSFRRSPSGQWTQLPTIGLPLNGNTADFFRLDVPSSGPAVMGIAQDGNIMVQRLTASAPAWSAPESVATNAYTLTSQLPTSIPGPGQPAPAFPILNGFDVAANSRGDAVAAWGTSGAYANPPGEGIQYGGTGDQIEYSRVLRTSADPTWPAATKSREPAFQFGSSSFNLNSVNAEMDNARRAVVAYASAGATNGNKNPLAVTTWNGTRAARWSDTRGFQRFCDTSGGIVGPSLATAGSRGVVVAWGCGSSIQTGFRPGLIYTRSYR